jgi:hypothetical protein
LGIVFVPEDETWVTKRWTLLQPRLPNGRIVAVKGEPGLQSDTLTSGLHFGYSPWRYSNRRLAGEDETGKAGPSSVSRK